MKEKLNLIKIIHLAICVSVLAAYFIIGGLSSLKNVKIPEINSTSIIYILICTSAIFGSNFLYNTIRNKSNKNTKEEDKLNLFFSANIARLVVLEGAAFIILFINKDYLLLGLIVIIYMLFLRPTEEQFKNEFN